MAKLDGVVTSLAETVEKFPFQSEGTDSTLNASEPSSLADAFNGIAFSDTTGVALINSCSDRLVLLSDLVLKRVGS